MQVEPVVARPPSPRESPVLALEAEGLASLGTLEQEALMINLDASLRLHASHHFFNWTQGTLQSLVAHELLICVLRRGEPMSLHFESFTTVPLELSRFNDMLRQDRVLMPNLVKAWEENHRRPLACDTRAECPFAASALARELNRIGATRVIAHGTYDASARVTSFFIFACRPERAGPKQAYLVELTVPFLHAAWLRTQVEWPADGAAAKPASASLLTSREIEILKWLFHGKSNIEIGLILGISPLTVKNHVQKILRKLNVLNRTQAVGKALALRIVNA